MKNTLKILSLAGLIAINGNAIFASTQGQILRADAHAGALDPAAGLDHGARMVAKNAADAAAALTALEAADGIKFEVAKIRTAVGGAAAAVDLTDLVDDGDSATGAPHPDVAAAATTLGNKVGYAAEGRIAARLDRVCTELGVGEEVPALAARAAVAGGAAAAAAGAVDAVEALADGVSVESRLNHLSTLIGLVDDRGYTSEHDEFMKDDNGVARGAAGYNPDHRTLLPALEVISRMITAARDLAGSGRAASLVEVFKGQAIDEI